MERFWINFAFSTVIELLRVLRAAHVDDDAAKQKLTYHKTSLKVFKMLWAVFGSDEDFRAVVGLPREEDA